MKLKFHLFSWLILALCQPLQADITVTGIGSITIPGSITINFMGSTLHLKDSGLLLVEHDGYLTGSTVVISPLAKLCNRGTVNAAIVNNGEMVSDCGDDAVVIGDITNNGIFRVSHDSTLQLTGTLQNNTGGLVDFITANQSMLPDIINNNGSVIGAQDLRITNFTSDTENIKIIIQGIPPHTYQLLCSPDLTAGSWLPIGPAKIASGEALHFEHIGVKSRSEKYFYKIAIADQLRH